MWKLWWKSSSSQTNKRQQKLEVNTKTKQKPEKQQNIQRQNKNLLTNKMATVDTGKKSWKNTALAKYTTSYWPTYDRSGKVATHFKCLL